MAESRSLVTRHIQEFVTRGDRQLLSVGRQLATADRARERSQRQLANVYRQVGAQATQTSTKETQASKRTTQATRAQVDQSQRLAGASRQLTQSILSTARAQLTEERALKSAQRQAAQYTAAQNQRAAASRRAATASRQSAEAAVREARQTASRGISAAGAAAATAGAGGIFGVAQLAKDAIDYQQQMSKVQAVAGATNAELRQMDKLAKELGAKTAYSASESAMAMGELAKAGFNAREVMSTLPGTIDLAAASGVGLAEAATIQADALRGFGLRTSDATRVADVFAVAVNRSSIEMSDLGYTLKYMAPIAATTGQSFEDMTAAVAILGNVGIRADTAGTTLRTLMVRLVKPTEAAENALSDLGTSSKALQGPNGLKPLPDIIAKLVAGAQKLPKAERLRALTTIFGREPIAGISTLVDKGAPALRKLSAEMTNADGAADRMARTMQDNVAMQAEQVKGAVETLALTIFDRFAPAMQEGATSAADAIQKFTDNKQNVDEITQAISDAVGVAGDLVQAGIPLASVVTDVFHAFSELPDEMRSTVLQAGLLFVVTRKLAGSAAIGGLLGMLGKLRGGLRATAVEAKTARVSLDMFGAPVKGPMLLGGAAGAAGKAGRLSKLSGFLGTALSGRTGAALGGAALGGGAAAALGSKSLMSGAASGAAVGMVAGPWGALAGAAIGGLIGGLRGNAKKKAEEAARRAAADIRSRTEQAMASGIQRPAAQRIAQAGRAATNTSGQLADARRQLATLQQQRAATPSTRSNTRQRLDVEIQEQIEKINQLSGKAREAGANVARQLNQGFGSFKFLSGTQMLADFRRQTARLAPEARAGAAKAMLEFARTMERDGRLPKGSTKRLIDALGQQPELLGPKWKKEGIKSVKQLDTAMKDRRAVASANKLTQSIGATFQGVPKVAARTLPGATAVLRTQLDRMTSIARNKNAPKEMREAAQRELPKLREQYRSTLSRMAERMGMSKKDAADWAAGVSRSARRAGSSADAVDELRDAVNRLNAKFLTGKEAARSVEKAWRNAGAAAKDAAAAGDLAAGVTGLIDGTFDTPRRSKPSGRNRKANRRGGLLQAFRGGGMVDVIASPGEALRFPGGDWGMVPGLPVAADTVPLTLPVGTEVYTGHGQELLAAGLSRSEALARQMPHFRTGGPVKPMAKGGFVATSYGPPWGGIQGQGITATGVNLKNAPKRYLIAVDPKVIPLHSRVSVWPNPFGFRGKFAAEDTGGAIKGNRIDFYDWRGRATQNAWGRRNVTVSKRARAAADGSTPSTPGYSYIKTTDDLTGFTARNARRQLWRWTRPSVDDAYGQAVTAARAGQTDRRYRGSLLADINAAARANIERQKVTVSGLSGKAGSTATSGSSSGNIGGRGKFNWPTRSRAVTSGFGARSSPGGRGSTNHDGIDIGVPVGTPVYAAARGRVTKAGPNGGYGNYVELQHRAGVSSFYGHLSRILTRVGRIVNSGTKIALSGNTGTSTGPHLHFGAHRNGSRIDPRTLLGRKFRRGGRVGTGATTATRAGAAVRDPAIRRSLSSLFAAGTRDNAQVTDALDDLNTLLADTDRATVGRLEALSAALRSAIRSTLSKSSPGGRSVTKGEEALRRRAQGALTLIDDELGVRTSIPLQRADQLARAAERNQRYYGSGGLRIRRLGVDEGSSAGLQMLSADIGIQATTKTNQRKELQKALRIAQRRGQAGAETAKAIQDEIDGLTSDINDLAVQRLENARAVIAARASEAATAIQNGIDARTSAVNRELRRQGIDQSSAQGYSVQGQLLAWTQEQQELRRATLAAARDQIAASGAAAGSQVADLNEQIRQLNEDIADLAVQQIEAAREQVRAAMQEAVDAAASRTSYATMGLQRLELQQRLDRTYDTGATQRADYISSTLVPALQAEAQRLREQQSREGDPVLARQIGEAIYAKENEIMQAQVDALELIASNTADRSFGGSLGFEFAGNQYTDLLMDSRGR